MYGLNKNDNCFLAAILTVAIIIMATSSMMTVPAAASPTTTNATTPITPTIELADKPFAVGRYRTISDNMASETQVQFTAEGNTTITLPNSTETITTRDTGEGTFSFLTGGAAGSPRGQIHMTTEDGTESVTAELNEIIKFDSPTGIGIAYFSTNSTAGMLAPLNNMIAVFLDEIQPNEDSVIRVL